MIISGTQHINIVLDVDEHEAKKFVLGYLKTKLKFPNGGYIKEDTVFVTNECYIGSHDYSQEVAIRKATPLDCALVLVLTELEKTGD